MDANPFSDLIPAKNPFADLIPVKKADEKKTEPALSDAITDIPSEISKAASENWQTIKKGVTDRGSKGPIEGLADTGKALLAIPGMIASPLTGTARSVLGHGLEEATHRLGMLINPEAASKEDRQAHYDAAKGDVDVAMAGARPAGLPVKVGGAFEWKPPAAPNPQTAPPSIEDLKAAAQSAYQGPELTGLEVKPHTIRNYSDQTQLSLNNEGFDENLAPKTFAILGKLQKIPANSTVTGQNFNSLRKMLGKAAGSTDATEAAAASHAIESLDNFIPAIGKGDVIAGDVGAAASALEDARGNWSAAKQAEKIDNKVVQAEVRAASANSGMNVANTIRQRMADVVLKPKEQRGLRPDEIEAAQKISEGTRTQNAIRTAGNILGGGGGLGTAVVGTIGGVATGGPGAALPLVGFALKALSNKMTVRQAGKLSEMIRLRAPLASSTQKFNQAAAQVQQNRTPQAIAGVVLAARNLSTNLRSAGMNFSPADLLSGLQSPSPAQADDQQQIPRPPGQ